MEVRGARTRQTTRRSNRAGVGEAREEEEGTRGAQPRRARSSPRRSAPQAEEVQSAAPSSDPRPRRSLRSSSVNAREEAEEEEKAAAQSATPSSGRFTPEEARSSGPQRALRSFSQYPWEGEKEALSTQSRRARSSGCRNARGEDEEGRSSRPGRPVRSTGKNAQEDVLAKRNTRGQNAREEDEAEGRRTCSPGAKHSLSKNTREEVEEMWSTRSQRPKRSTSGDEKVQGATPMSARSSPGRNARGEREAAPQPGARSWRARSGTGGDVKVREEEKKRVLGTRSWRRVASAPVKYALGGEDEAAPRTRGATRRPGAGDEVRAGTSGNLGAEACGEEELVRRALRPPPTPCGDARNYALDASAQRAMPGSSSRDEFPPAASYGKESGEEERREEDEEDEDCNMVRQLLRLKDQIKQQLLEYKAEVEASKESPTEELAEGDLLQRIEDLERKMEEVKIELEMKTLALRRVQVAHALQKKLEKKDSESESILAILKNILTLNSSILKAQQQTRDLEEKMLEVKKKRLMFKKAGEEKLLEIQAENKKKKDELNLLKNSAMLTKMKKSLQKEIDSTTIIQNVFQHIVMAAKIDWAADPALKALILQLEKNLSFI